MVFKLRFGLSVFIICLLLINNLLWATTNKILVSDNIIQQVTAKYGDDAGKRLQTWKQLMANESGLPENKKLELVNIFFNQMQYRSDMEVWGKVDYWATPIEFLATNAGNCTEFSMSKFFTLVSLGVDENKLRLLYVKALKLNEAHMVLAYYTTPTADPLILDNLIPEIKLASQRQDLVPLYAFNGLGLWEAKKIGAGRKLGDASKIDNWNEINERMSKEVYS